MKACIFIGQLNPACDLNKYYIQSNKTTILSTIAGCNAVLRAVDNNPHSSALIASCIHRPIAAR
jgi:hypothetical protein